MRRYGLSEKEAIERYKRMGADPFRIYDSHKRQKESLSSIIKFLDNPKVFAGERLNESILRGVDLIVALGGDNYFQFISHFLNFHLITGVNSDPVTSQGSLLYFNTENFAIYCLGF